MYRQKFENFNSILQAIHGYRETERAKWNEDNTKIMDRVRKLAFPPGMPQLGLVHVLDLAAEGRIKPHVDSVRVNNQLKILISILTAKTTQFSMILYGTDYMSS